MTNHANGITSFSDYSPSGSLLQYDVDPPTDNGSPGSAGLTNLPIVLSSFKGVRKDDQIELSWTTSLEVNNDYMAVESSMDTRSFIEIGRVRGACTTSEVQKYSFTDRHPETGTNYYRLRQVDFDGQTTYHQVIAVAAGQQAAAWREFRLFPTLARHQLQWRFTHPPQLPLPYTLFNPLGQLIQSGTLAAGTAEGSIDINGLSAGSYVMRLQQNGVPHSWRFVKQ